MFKRAYAYYLVLSRALIFRSGKRDHSDFWAWLYLRLYDPGSIDFENEILAKYLFVDALKDSEHYRVAKIFRDYQSQIEPKLSPERHEKVVYSLFVAETLGNSDYKPIPLIYGR